MKATSEIIRVGGAFCWIEDQRVIHLKAAGKDGEPVELDSAAARKLSESLGRLATTLAKLEADAPG